MAAVFGVALALGLSFAGAFFAADFRAALAAVVPAVFGVAVMTAGLVAVAAPLVAADLAAAVRVPVARGADAAAVRVRWAVDPARAVVVREVADLPVPVPAALAGLPAVALLLRAAAAVRVPPVAVRVEADRAPVDSVDREPVVREPVVREPVVREPVVREPVVREPVPELPEAVNFGSFSAPDRMSLKYLPGRNAGTVVRLTFTASPVRGFLAVRAALARFSKTPNPEMETLSPPCTSR